MKAHGQASRQGESSRTPTGRAALQPALGRGLHSVGKAVHSATREGGCCSTGGSAQTGDLARLSALVLDASAGGWLFCPGGTGTAWPQGRAYDDLSRRCWTESRRPWSSKPGGRSINESVFIRIRIIRSLEKRLCVATAFCSVGCGNTPTVLLEFYPDRFAAFALLTPIRIHIG